MALYTYLRRHTRKDFIMFKHTKTAHDFTARDALALTNDTKDTINHLIQDVVHHIQKAAENHLTFVFITGDNAPIYSHMSIKGELPEFPFDSEAHEQIREHLIAHFTARGFHIETAYIEKKFGLFISWNAPL